LLSSSNPVGRSVRLDKHPSTFSITRHIVTSDSDSQRPLSTC
jgi:hypothetical protein